MPLNLTWTRIVWWVTVVITKSNIILCSPVHIKQAPCPIHMQLKTVIELSKPNRCPGSYYGGKNSWQPPVTECTGAKQCMPHFISISASHTHPLQNVFIYLQDDALCDTSTSTLTYNFHVNKVLIYYSYSTLLKS